jgi:ElaB/YqjD/DUF883 family membrane-anchored ribosome-binding protein
MALADRSIPGQQDAAAQIAKLREQVEVLMRERISPALADVAGRAETAMGAMKDQAEALSGQVKERPIAAILVALAVGFAIGRVLR